MMTEVKLFIGNLPGDASESELIDFFSKFGYVSSVCLLGPTKSKSGNACGFIKFIDEEVARMAIATLDGKSTFRATDTLLLQVRLARNGGISGERLPTSFEQPAKRPLSLPAFDQFSRQESSLTKLFVGCLPPGINSDQLTAVFAASGVELQGEVHVMRGKGASGQSCAFVFVHNAMATEVVYRMNGKPTLDGCVMRIKFAESTGGYSPSKRLRSNSDASTTFSNAVVAPIMQVPQRPPLYVLPPAKMENSTDIMSANLYPYLLMPLSYAYHDGPVPDAINDRTGVVTPVQHYTPPMAAVDVSARPMGYQSYYSYSKN